MASQAAHSTVPLLQLTRSGILLPGGDQGIARLREQFARTHVIRLFRFLEPGLLQTIHAQLDRAEFQLRVHDGVGTELCMAHNLTSHLLHLLMNEPRLHDVVRQISGGGPIGCFSGRVYRVVPSAGHHDSWHDDLADGRRMIGMSVNLSTAVFSGSRFELRDSSSKAILCRVANTGFGDAILFRLAEQLEHRISPLEGSVPKSAFAGWFQSEPDFQSLLHEQLAALGSGASA